MNPTRKLALDVFADAASMVLRVLFKEPQGEWTSVLLAKQSGTSVAWVNHVLNALEEMSVVERRRAGGKSTTKLLHPGMLLKKWTDNYNFSRNELHPFYVRNENDRSALFGHFVDAKISHAATGYYAVSLLSNYVVGAPEMIYVYPSAENCDYGEFITGLENRFSLLPVKKGANLIILKPYYRKGVFFDLKEHGGRKIVSHFQLYLDLYHADQGMEFIKELGLPYA